MTGPVLRVRDLDITFRSEGRTVHAVQGLGYDLAPGEVLAVVGESGCGKSISALSVLGLQPRTATVTGSVRLGEVELVGASTATLRDIRGDRVSMIFQEPLSSLNPVLTVRRQLTEVLRRHRGLSGTRARERAIELLGLVGIPAPRQRIDLYPHQLSGGMRQRVVIAIAIACDPEVLIADEPTTALDVTVQAGILTLLDRLRAELNMAIVLITHDLGVVADIADRVLVMYAGRGVETAPVAELFANPEHPYTNGLLGAVPRPGSVADRLAEIPGTVPALAVQPDACTFADRCPRAADDCRAARPALAGPGEHLVACWHPMTNATAGAQR